MARQIQDASTEVKISKALPNANAVANSDPIDLGATVPFPIQEQISVKLSISAATGANSKNINIAIQESAESNANFTNIAELASWRNANDGSVYTAATRTVALPPGVKRYIRTTAAGEANGGDASDGTSTIQLLF